MRRLLAALTCLAGFVVIEIVAFTAIFEASRRSLEVVAEEPLSFSSAAAVMVFALVFTLACAALVVSVALLCLAVEILAVEDRC